MTHRRLPLALLVALSLVLPPAAFGRGSIATAQDAGPTIVAQGLTNPRGFTWDATGNLVIAEAGTGGQTEASGEVEIPPPTGPYTGGTTARITKTDNGCPVMVAQGLPSATSATGETIGVADVAYLGETLYALVAGGGAAHGNPDQPSGIYTVGADGSSALLVDLGQWLRDNPVANPPEIDFDPEGSFYAMTAAPDASALWVVESNSEQVLSVTPDGEVTRIADLSAENQVPTAIAAAPDGGLYVGHLTSAPFPEGKATVVKVDLDGTVTTVWTGLTTVTGLAVVDDGTLYASQLSTTRERAPFLEPGTGSIVRQTGKSTSEAVATGLDFPVALEIGPDEALYVSLPAVGGSEGTGSVIRIVPGSTAVAIDSGTLPKQSCGDGTAGTDTNKGSEASTSEVVVRIFDFGFDPASLTIPVGTTVIWANTGAAQHTTVAFVDGKKYWDSNIMEPGDTYSFTFTEPGTWDYVCGLHPNMKGTIVVE